MSYNHGYAGYPPQQNGWQQPYQPNPPQPNYSSYPQQDYSQPAPGNYQQAPPPNGAPPAYSFYPPTNENKENYTFNDAFKLQQPKYNDIWAGILFLVAQGGFLAIAALALTSYTGTNRAGHGIYDGDSSFGLNTSTAILFAFCLGVAFVLGYLYINVARAFPKQFIWVTGILNIVLAIATGVYYLWAGTTYAGVVFLVFGVLQIIFFIGWRKRIPFSAFMLRTATDVAKGYGHVWMASFFGGLVGIAFGALFSATLVGLYVRYDKSSHSQLIGFIAYITFAMYWFTEWLKYTIHTTVSGVYASWYFSPRNFPKHATRSSLRRAVTYSFGSISLGSLITAIIQALRQLCSVVRSQAGADNNIGLWILFCCLDCILSCINWAADFINRFAFSHIALYGAPYIQAAKDTWNMIKQRGIDALVNDCLIGPVFSMGAMMVGYITALLAYLYLRYTDPVYNKGGDYTAVVMAYAFLIGFQVTNIFTTPISSGIDTIFVAAGWDPEVMRREHPELWGEMAQTYPEIMNGLHG
ncbi:Protein PNS1 [Ceratocystis lukuohia]|uniref:Protein PNS1 n=2 Tax=Ceratocystis TaxID=5157 RepID=A0A2C5WXH3_9PEZI|nr:Protein PNS1 [Ceratocystis fimbriata CBS 114723]